MTEKNNRVMAQANSYIAKIEGHGSLNVDFKKKKVQLIVHEGERLFEGILCERTLEEMQWITPRICGVCPIAHNLASLAAADAALGIKVTRTTRRLRRLNRRRQIFGHKGIGPFIDLQHPAVQPYSTRFQSNFHSDAVGGRLCDFKTVAQLDRHGRHMRTDSIPSQNLALMPDDLT